MKNGKVVVSKEAASVALGAKWRAKDDNVLGKAAVEHKHCAHGTASVVEHPFRVLHNVLAVLCPELVNDNIHERSGVIGVSLVLLNGRLGNLLQRLRIKHVVLVEMQVHATGDNEANHSKEKERLEAEAPLSRPLPLLVLVLVCLCHGSLFFFFLSFSFLLLRWLLAWVNEIVHVDVSVA